MDILKQEELFLYHDRDGALVSVPMLYKPAGFEVQHNYVFADLLAVMLRRLSGSGTHTGMQLYETGDERAYGYPFVLVDVKADLVLFLQQPPGIPAETGPAGGTLQLFLRMIPDHVRGVISQPVSSLVRLFTLVGGTTADIARPVSPGLLDVRPPRRSTRVRAWTCNSGRRRSTS